ncbi:MAG: EAL domain-containing protein [Alphaproteobacteria bacterium]|nr:EAL domain-containing protein [Alphaproteobacteria bacterium]
MLQTSQISLKSCPVVLVIEDEPGDAQLIRLQLLEREPGAFVVHLAGSLEAAKNLINVQGVRPDVLLLDLNLPDSTGIATIERCRNLIDDVPVVVLTGLDDASAMKTAIQSGAEDYLTKDSDGSALRKAVRYAILRHLRDADARLASTVFMHAREGILVTDADGIIIDVNDAFTRITGYQRDEVIQRSPSLLKSGHHGAEFYEVMWRDLAEQGHWFGEIWNRRKNGEVYAEMLTISTVRDGRDKIRHYVGLFSDVTLQKEHERQLELIAHYDALTKLPNRVLLSDRLHQAMAQSLRRSQLLAVVYIDLDGFKAVNDSYGHESGDQLLVAVAARMKLALREGDTIARLGGDEFAAVLCDLADTASSLPVLSRLLEAADHPVHLGSLALHVSASIGVSYYPQAESVDADQLLRQADQAMYQAKLAGKNRYHVFDADLDRSVRGIHESLQHIRRALNENEFALYYQPKVNMRSGAIVGVEALIRWHHPERGLLPPSVFLPVIEDHPLAIELGEWVINSALSQLKTWQDAGLNFPISVNISAFHLQRADFLDRLRYLLGLHPKIKPGSLELEVLETSALQDISQVSELMQACRELGLSFALDDFGTGYSSLTYLKRLPCSLLKIDQSFVHDMLDDPDDLAILEGVLGLATAFRRQVIAEGVESVEHGNLLLQLGCELAQGYGIAKPMPAKNIPDWVQIWRPDKVWATQPTVSRSGLPIIFASVEFRSWVKGVVEYLNGSDVSPPQVYAQDCRFCAWLASQESPEMANNVAFRDIEKLHLQIHELASELLAAKRNNQAQDFAEMLRRLLKLRDKTIDQMRSLLFETEGIAFLPSAGM